MRFLKCGGVDLNLPLHGKKTDCVGQHHHQWTLTILPLSKASTNSNSKSNNLMRLRTNSSCVSKDWKCRWHRCWKRRSNPKMNSRNSNCNCKASLSKRGPKATRGHPDWKATRGHPDCKAWKAHPENEANRARKAHPLKKVDYFLVVLQGRQLVRLDSVTPAYVRFPWLPRFPQSLQYGWGVYVM